MKKSTSIAVGIIGIVLLGLILAVGMYNGLVKKDVAVSTAWAQVENVLQRRADLIPNLVSSVKGYVTHERGVLDDLAEARTRYAGAATIDAKIKAAGEMEGALGRFLPVPDELGRHAGHYGPGLHIAADHRACGDHGMIADGDPRKHRGTRTDPHVVADSHGSIDDGLVDDVTRWVALKLIRLRVDDDPRCDRAPGSNVEAALPVEHAELIDVRALPDTERALWTGGVEVGVAKERYLIAQAYSVGGPNDLDVASEPERSAGPRQPS